MQDCEPVKCILFAMCSLVYAICEREYCQKNKCNRIDDHRSSRSPQLKLALFLLRAIAAVPCFGLLGVLSKYEHVRDDEPGQYGVERAVVDDESQRLVFSSNPAPSTGISICIQY